MNQTNLPDPGVNHGEQESSYSALGASTAKVVVESDGTKSPVPALVSPINTPTPIVFGGQFQDVQPSNTVTEGETRNYVDDAGHNNVAEIVGSNTDGTVNILVDAGVGRIRRDGVPWKKEGMKGNYVE